MIKPAATRIVPRQSTNAFVFFSAKTPNTGCMTPNISCATATARLTES